MSFSGDPRLKNPNYFHCESDFERAEFIEREEELMAERRRHEKTGSDIDKFLDKNPMAEFND